MVLFIHITRLASKEIFSQSNKMLAITLILLPILLYIIPTATNNKEINIHDTVIENVKVKVKVKASVKVKLSLSKP